MKLSSKYSYLLGPDMPKMITEALNLYGTVETPGAGNNATIMAWAKEVGEDVAKIYYADAVAWCGLFMAVVAKRAGKQVPKAPLWALNWSAFGHSADCAMLGDVITFVRTTSTGTKAGHVALYVGEDAKYYHVLGGNQSDAVTITRIAKTRKYAIRRPDYSIIPKTVKPVILEATGSVSAKES